MLEMAILGLLSESPMHGYELRKRLNTMLGTFRKFSYGSLYPTLRRMESGGLVSSHGTTSRIGGRSKVVYELTAEGKERLSDLLDEAGPSAWEDETFGVHFAFFSQTDPQSRLRILEGRRTRLEEKRDRVRGALARTRERLDAYTLELQRHGLESVEHEVRWLNELIETERSGGPPQQREAEPPGGPPQQREAEPPGGPPQQREPPASPPRDRNPTGPTSETP